MKTNLLALALLSALLAGCANHGYVKPEDIPGVKHPGKANLYDFKLAADKAIEKMKGSEKFSSRYKETKASVDGRTPILMVGNIDYGSRTENPRMLPYFNNLRTQLREALNESDLFDIVDDASAAESDSEETAAAITKPVEIGLVNPDGPQVFGTHVNADYRMAGYYREFEGEGRYSYVVELTLKNLHTGKNDWIGTVYVEKE